jgi:hypothetical protein
MLTIMFFLLLLVFMRAVFLASKISSFARHATGVKKMDWFWENAYPKRDPIARIVKWLFW